LDPVGSASKLAFFQNVKKAGGLDALELFDTVFKSKAFGVRPVCLCAVIPSRVLRLFSVCPSPPLPPPLPLPPCQNQQILDNVEVQHRLMEEIPILGAIPGFQEVKGRRLSDEEVGAEGREGREGGRGVIERGASSFQLLTFPSISSSSLCLDHGRV